MATFLERGLAAQGYQVLAVASGQDGAGLAVQEDVDFVVLDLGLPDLDGHQVLSRIRAQRPDLPVLMLTGRDDVTSKVQALDSGADDYLTKPFAFAELVSRIRARLRGAGQPESRMLELGDLRLDLRARRVWRSGQALDLTAREFALLEYLVRNRGAIVSRQQILSAVWEYDFDPSSNVVDVYIRYLRRKIDRPREASLVTTVRGVGYRFEPQAAAIP